MTSLFEQPRNQAFSSSDRFKSSSLELEKLPTTRKAAIAQGLGYYYTAKPCKHNHIAARRVSGQCIECSKLNMRSSYHLHREKNLQKARMYIEKNRQEIYEKRKVRHLANPEALKARSAAYYVRHRERILEQTANYRTLNRDTVNQYFRDNPRPGFGYTSHRRAHVKTATLIVDLEKIKDFYRQCPPGWEVDHIVPIKHALVCGLHCLANLQYLPATVNRRKSNTWMPE